MVWSACSRRRLYANRARRACGKSRPRDERPCAPRASTHRKFQPWFSLLPAIWDPEYGYPYSSTREILWGGSLRGGGGLAQLEGAGFEAVLGAQHDFRIELMLQRFE